MALADDFKKAQEAVNSCSPSQDEKLQLYAWYKQGTEGDVQGARPGDFVAGFKYDARVKVKGKSKDEAMAGYVALVKKLGGAV